MANLNTPFGFRPVRDVHGRPWAGGLSTYRIDSGTATAIFTGDPVTFNTTGFITQAAAGGIVCGIFMGCKFNDASGMAQRLPYWPAAQVTQGAVDAEALVIDDPSVLFEAQMSAAMVTADLGANFNTTTMAAGSTTTGQSIAQLDYGSLNTTALQFRAMAFVSRPDNDVASAYAKVLVQPNLSFFRSTTGI